MDDEQRTLESQEELNAEKDTVVEVSEETLREKMAESLELDLEELTDEQSALLDRVVKLKQEDNKRLSKAIEQKRKYREQLFSTNKNKETKSQNSSKETPDIEEIATRKAMELLEARDLEALNLSEDLEEEVKRIAKIQGISVREAAKDPYFAFKKQEYEKAERIRKATPTRKGGSKYIIDPDKPLNSSEFDMSTEEGREAWKQAKEAKRKAGK